MKVKTVSREAEYKYDQYKRLKLIKRALLLGSALSFTVINRADVSAALQFLWSCYVSQRHDQPFEELYAASYSGLLLRRRLVGFYSAVDNG